jgi:hypothetical protein
MSLYEILAVLALACGLGYAFYLYRSDIRLQAGASDGPSTGSTGGGLMFGRSRDRMSGSSGAKAAEASDRIQRFGPISP